MGLCPACDDEIAAEEQGRLEAGASWLAGWGGLLGSVWGTICLTVAHVPVLLSIVLMWTLARLRVVGCSVLAFYVVAFSMLALGREPQRYPARILPLWGAITGVLVVWKYRYTIMSWFGLKRKTIENDTAGRPAIVTNR